MIFFFKKSTYDKGNHLCGLHVLLPFQEIFHFLLASLVPCCGSGFTNGFDSSTSFGLYERIVSM